MGAARAVRIKIDADPYEAVRIAQAYRVGGLIFVSGQVAYARPGERPAGRDFESQAERCFENLDAVLRAGGSDLSKVIKVNIYLKNMANFPKIVALRERYFTPPYPADSIVEVSSLAGSSLEIEIEAVALAAGEIIG